MLKLHDLYKVYRTDEVETVALNGVNFEVDEGDFVAGELLIEIEAKLLVAVVVGAQRLQGRRVPGRGGPSRSVRPTSAGVTRSGSPASDRSPIFRPPCPVASSR